jgi:hypothetical protein
MLWGSIAIIAAHYGIDLFPANPWLALAMRWGAPWITLAGGFLAWSRARLWRRLHRLRSLPGPLIRDPGAAAAPAERPGGLERLAALVIATGMAAIVYQLNLPGPETVLAAGLAFWLFKGIAAAALKAGQR